MCIIGLTTGNGTREDCTTGLADQSSALMALLRCLSDIGHGILVTLLNRLSIYEIEPKHAYTNHELIIEMDYKEAIDCNRFPQGTKGKFVLEHIDFHIIVYWTLSIWSL